MKKKRGQNLDSIRTPLYDRPQSVASLRQLSGKTGMLSDMDRNRCPLSSESAITVFLPFSSYECRIEREKGDNHRWTQMDTDGEGAKAKGKRQKERKRPMTNSSIREIRAIRGQKKWAAGICRGSVAMCAAGLKTGTDPVCSNAALRPHRAVRQMRLANVASHRQSCARRTTPQHE